MGKHLLHIAFRNISRNRRRTVLNMIALSLGMTIMIFAIGWVRGYFTTLYDGMISLDTGHVQILNNDYMAEDRRVPLDLLVQDYEARRADILAVDGVEQCSGRIAFEVELGNGREYMPMRGRGIDPRYEADITSVRESLSEGAWFSSNEDPGVLIGYEAAELLGVSVGDTVFLRVRDRYSAPNTTAVPVIGIVRFGYPLFDRFMLFTSFESAGAMLRLDGAATHLVVRADSGVSIDRLVTRLQDVVPDDLAVYPWQEFAQTMIRAVQADVGSFFVFMIILFLLIILGILNSMSMTVRERGREIGTMRAIGLKKGQLRFLLLSESAATAIFSAAVAVVFGGAAAAYVQFVGFDVAGMMPADLPIPFGERFYGDYSLFDFVISLGVGLATAILGSILPAQRAVRMSIAQTMRTEG